MGRRKRPDRSISGHNRPGDFLPRQQPIDDESAKARPSRLLGLYQLTDCGGRDCVRVHWDAGDAAPFVPRDVYDAAGFAPPFERLPTKAAYLANRPERAQLEETLARIARSA